MIGLRINKVKRLKNGNIYYHFTYIITYMKDRKEENLIKESYLKVSTLRTMFVGTRPKTKDYISV